VVAGEALLPLLEQLTLDYEQLFPGALCSVLLLDEDGRSSARPPRRTCRLLLPGPGRPGHLPHRRLLRRRHGPGPAHGGGGHRHPPELGALQGPGGPGRPGVLLVRADSRAERPGAGLLRDLPPPPGHPTPEELEHLQFSAQLASTAIIHGRTAEALQQSQRRLSAILEAIPDLIWLADGEGRYQACNAAFERFVNLPRQDILQQPRCPAWTRRPARP
jgi:PAS domain-containing protein